MLSGFLFYEYIGQKDVWRNRIMLRKIGMQCNMPSSEERNEWEKCNIVGDFLRLV